jgi:hypothetical protein
MKLSRVGVYQLRDVDRHGKTRKPRRQTRVSWSIQYYV